MTATARRTRAHPAARVLGALAALAFLTSAACFVPIREGGGESRRRQEGQSREQGGHEHGHGEHDGDREHR